MSNIISWRDTHIDWHQVNIYPESQAFYVRISTYHSQAVHKPPRVSTEGSVSSTPGHFYPTVCQSQVEILHLATGKLVRVICFLPHPWIISTHVSLDILHLLPWPSFPLLAPYVTHRSSAPHPHAPQSPLLEGQLPPLSLSSNIKRNFRFLHLAG